jgi:hypothetical protein
MLRPSEKSVSSYIATRCHRPEDHDKNLKVDPVEKKLAQYKMVLMMLTRWKTLNTRNKALTFGLTENEDLDNHERYY